MHEEMRRCHLPIDLFHGDKYHPVSGLLHGSAKPDVTASTVHLSGVTHISPEGIMATPREPPLTGCYVQAKS